MADSNQALLEAEEMRNKFIGRVRGDLTNLYRVYCLMSEFAQAIGDEELLGAVAELLRIWDDLSNTVAVKVIANGFVEWIQTGCEANESRVGD